MSHVKSLVLTSSGLIMCHVIGIQRHRDPRRTIIATGHHPYADESVLMDMPNGVGDEAHVIFVNPKIVLTDENLPAYFRSKSFAPIDPCTLCAINEAEKDFSKEYKNATFWKDADGKLCFQTFYFDVDDQVPTTFVKSASDEVFDKNTFWWGCKFV